jgi:hypothetical protein
MATTESAPQVSNSSDCTPLSGDSLYDTSNTWVAPPSTTNTTDFNFITCSGSSFNKMKRFYSLKRCVEAEKS